MSFYTITLKQKGKIVYQHLRAEYDDIAQLEACLPWVTMPLADEEIAVMDEETHWIKIWSAMIEAKMVKG